MPRRRRLAYRRGRDAKWQVWLPLGVTLLAYVVGGVGIYVKMSSNQAVQTEQILNLQHSLDAAKGDLKDRTDSLQRNLEGLERYIIELHGQDDKKR